MRKPRNEFDKKVFLLEFFEKFYKEIKATRIWLEFPTCREFTSKTRLEIWKENTYYTCCFSDPVFELSASCRNKEVIEKTASMEEALNNSWSSFLDSNDKSNYIEKYQEMISYFHGNCSYKKFELPQDELSGLFSMRFEYLENKIKIFCNNIIVKDMSKPRTSSSWELETAEEWILKDKE